MNERNENEFHFEKYSRSLAHSNRSADMIFFPAKASVSIQLKKYFD